MPAFDVLQTQLHPSTDIGIALEHLVSLQVKQTELSSLLINQQRAAYLPVKEPPVFSGNSFEYPAFVAAFDSIITNNVHTEKDRLFFLDLEALMIVREHMFKNELPWEICEESKPLC